MKTLKSKNIIKVKTVKMYKILTQIHLNYKIIKIMLKIIFTFMDCLIAWLRELKSLITLKKHCMPWKIRAWGN